MKKIISLFLVFALISISLVNVFAVSEEPIFGGAEISPCYEYMTNLKSILTISSKSATCKSTVMAKSGVTKIVVTQKLQKKSNDKWTSVATWSKTFTSISAVYTNKKSSLSSGTYRTRTVAKVYKGSTYETVTKNSIKVTT